MLKNKNGITLIALIVTIIILLLLAGITISQLTGSGLFTKTVEAAKQQKKAQCFEEISLEIFTENIDRNTVAKEEYLIESLKKRIEVKGWTSEEKIVMCKETANGYEPANIEDSNILLIETNDGYEMIVEVNNITLEANIRNYFEKIGKRITVTLEPNGGEGEKEEKEVRKGFKIQLEEPSYTKSGYKFVGWCEDKNGEGTRYLAGSEYKVEANTKLYAIWEENIVTITLMANDGTEGKTEKIATPNEETTLPSNAFTREGYYFINWNTEADGTGTTYENGAKITINENITLYAQWEIKVTATMSFKVNNVSGVKKITEGTKITIGATALGSGIQKVELKIGSYTMFTATPGTTTYTKEIGINELSKLANLLFYSKSTATLTVTSVSNHSEKVTQSNVQNFTVGSAASLKQLATTVNGGNTLEGETILQISNIDLSTVCSSTKGTWNPIGYMSTTNYSFNGTYNGNNKNITNLYINNSTDKSVGLFGLIGENATVKNITLSGNVTSTDDDRNTGGIAGACYGIIENCINNAIVTGIKNVGGICGTYNNSSVPISDCANKGTINGNINVGGIYGAGKGECTRSYNEGSITGSLGYVGGIVGSSWNYGEVTISYCYNKGDITGNGDDSTGYTSVGGIAGVYRGTIIYCYNRGDIYGKLGQAAGIIGNGYGNGENCVQYCYNTGTITGGNRAIGSILGEGYNSSINYCYWTSSNNGIGYRGTTNNSKKMTVDELKQYTNSYFVKDTGLINDGYPVLKWQVSE